MSIQNWFERNKKIETNVHQYKLRSIQRKSLENVSCKYHVLIYVDNRGGSSWQVTPATQVVFAVLWPLLLTWFNFNLSMDK